MSTFIIDNLKVLLAAVQAQPADELDLANYQCGTCFCVAGLATQLPHFQDLGWSMPDANCPEVQGVPIWEDQEAPDGSGLALESLLDAQLGTNADARLLYGRLFGAWDCDFVVTLPAGFTDKDLAIARIKRQLAIYEGEQA